MTRAHHVGLTVADLDRSIAFYYDLLGLAFHMAPTAWFEDEHLPQALGVGAPVKLRLTAFRFDDGETVLELLQYGSPRSDRDRALVQNQVGACHVAILVDDIDKIVGRLQASQVPFNSGVHDIDEGPFAGWRWVYFKDPDGHTIEFVEIRYEDAARREQDIRDYLASRGAADTA